MFITVKYLKEISYKLSIKLICPGQVCASRSHCCSKFWNV